MTFQTFTGKEYLKIDIANSFGHGLDKDTWDQRIKWFDDNESNLDKLLNQAEEPALFYAGVQAWKAACKGTSTSYPISLDATCSGIQILAALACDRKAAELCNVVDVGRRADAYVEIYQDMLNATGGSSKIDRKLTKKAIMTAFYNSTAMPKLIFGEGQFLELFYGTLQNRAPGAWEINETMLAIWDPGKFSNDWVLPDNFHVHIKVMARETEMVNFLNEPFEVSYEVNKPMTGGRSLGANMVHSLDGMIVREIERRCNYDWRNYNDLVHYISRGAAGRSVHREKDALVQTLWDHYQRTNFLSARILSYLDMENLGLVNPRVIKDLLESLPDVPFRVMSVHDCFRCLPNYGNDLRRQYNILLAQIAGSSLLGDIVSQIVGRPIVTGKLDPSMVSDIFDTNYALS
jgi:hypothetical protein